MVQAALADLLAAHRAVCSKLKLEEDVTVQENSRWYIVSKEGNLHFDFYVWKLAPAFSSIQRILHQLPHCCVQAFSWLHDICRTVRAFGSETSSADLSITICTV